MQSKKLIALSMLAAMLACSMLFSVAAAQDTSSNREVDPSTLPDAAPLIAPAPDENTTAAEGDQIFYALDENSTAAADNQAPGSEDAPLIAPQTIAASDNSLVFIAIGVLVVVIGASAAGVVYHRRNASKQQI
jgi:flagellar basal body-associated protein FliL